MTSSVSNVSYSYGNQYYNDNYENYAPLPPKKVQDCGNYYLETYEEEATSGKKWGVGIASALIPGLGQAINGEWGKAIGFFLGDMATHIGAILLGGMILGRKPILGVISAYAACVGMRAWSIINAVRNAKSEYTVLVPKQNMPEAETQTVINQVA